MPSWHAVLSPLSSVSFLSFDAFCGLSSRLPSAVPGFPLFLILPLSAASPPCRCFSTMYAGIGDPSGGFGAPAYEKYPRGEETKTYRLVNGKFLPRYVSQPVRLLGFLKSLEESGSRLVFTTTDGVTVSCALASPSSEDAATMDKVLAVCGIVSAASPPLLTDAFFTPLGNELNSEQADEVVALAHHDFFSPFYSAATDAPAGHPH
ncbi:replication factor a protein 3 protein [Toxoplasma gondii VEG]|uniref:Replication factor a protein 3 protein n=1 Tax=Toxoplasma gondii (strain ATCC 50861 / VEG) TaxID=432359 RepID=V4ZFM0_TOXGV|nr:replication factor a protein 3 protein [Toxoplasma gondii VEG]